MPRNSTTQRDVTTYPEPTIQDACGLKNDSFTIPNTDANENGDTYTIDGIAYYDANHGGGTYSTDGKSSLSAEVDDADYHAIAGPWTLAFTDKPCGKEARNRIVARASHCRSSRWTEAVTLRNVKDPTGLPIDDITSVVAFRFADYGEYIISDDGTSTAHYHPTVPDGSSLTFHFAPANGEGLDAGYYTVKIARSKHPAEYVSFVLHRCSGSQPEYGTRVSMKASKVGPTVALKNRQVDDPATTFKLLAKEDSRKRSQILHGERDATTVYSCKPRRGVTRLSTRVCIPSAKYTLLMLGQRREVPKHWFVMLKQG